ncbi:phosphatidylglycerophosphate synthase, putative [Eimeria maxima]|uniref:CDP-diacylglycerol--glycerol-3-phosphate 3-phosphatidyltransferase n=1 Tax=Eimeria maxima TaxID=5804 RepID=U6MA84_EIMMA|nr:phosphatidylglycerophosphate synthase, putative [Eimeria maxima]CDJ58535.1 phosphatidylglycerophosphate synthase, putative [Eimeria maxima]
MPFAGNALRNAATALATLSCSRWWCIPPPATAAHVVAAKAAAGAAAVRSSRGDPRYAFRVACAGTASTIVYGGGNCGFAASRCFYSGGMLYSSGSTKAPKTPSIAAASPGLAGGSAAGATAATAAAGEVCFAVPPRCISVVRGPEALYSAVLELISSAQRRLLFSALYVGTGPKERHLLQLVQQQQRQQHQLQVRLLLDLLRTTRPEGASGESSARLLQPLLASEQHHKQQWKQPRGSSCRVSLFCNPLTCSNPSTHSSSRSGRLWGFLQGLVLRVLGHRAQEALGTQHMKCIVSDDLLLLTGANCSGNYFSNRTDRCLLVRCRHLADAADRILAAVEAHSFRLCTNPPPQQQQQNQQQQEHRSTITLGGALCYWPETNPSEPPSVNPQQFCRSLSQALADAIKSSTSNSRNCSNSSSNNGECGNNGKCSNRTLGINSKAGNSKNNSHITSSVSNQTTTSSSSELCLVTLSVQAGFACPPMRGQDVLLERLCAIAADSVAAAAAGEGTAAGTSPAAPGDIVAAPGGLHVVVASPYLNFPDAFLQQLQNLLQQMRGACASSAPLPPSSSGSTCSSSRVRRRDSRLLVITASPEANSFFKSKGPSFYIPAAYSVAAHEASLALQASAAAWKAAPAAAQTAPPATATAGVKRAVRCIGQQRQQQQHADDNLLLLEFARPGWTYHAKGIWLFGSTSSSNTSNTNSSSESDGGACVTTPILHSTRELLHNSLTRNPASNSSCSSNCVCSRKIWAAMSLLGSSNLSVRSSVRDLELLCLLRTRDEQLVKQLQQEVYDVLLPFCVPAAAHVFSSRFPLWLQFAFNSLGLRSLL